MKNFIQKPRLLLTALTLVGAMLLTTIGARANDWSGPDFIAALDSNQTVPFESNDASGFAFFRFNRNKTKLFYTIVLNDLDLDGFVTQGSPGDDVTKIHFHNAPRGVVGPHILNVYKLPRQDDSNIVIKPFKGVIKGRWDDSDENLNGAPSIKLTDAISILCSGSAYVNVHSVDHAPGVVRGQIMPTSHACRKLGY